MTFKRRAHWTIAVATIGAATAVASANPPNFVVFVDQDASHPFPDGSSWERAFTNLDQGLDTARLDPSLIEVWVAEGTYKHNDDGIASIRSSFVIPSGVRVYGGFDGTVLPPFSIPGPELVSEHIPADSSSTE